jgi:glycosyltransferase involved in cell wall biosynthesis
MTSDSLVHLTPRYLPTLGGVEMVVKELCERLAARGYSVGVFSADLREGLPQEERINGVHVRRFKRVYGDPLYLPFPAFFRELRRTGASVVHVHNIHTSMPLSALALARGPGLVLQPHYHRYGQNTARDILLGAFKRLLHHLVLPRFQSIVANSTYEEGILKADFPRCAEKILHIEEAIDTDELRTVRWKPEMPRRILYIGNLLKYKNVDRLLDAFSRLTPTNDLRLVIVGDGPEGKNLRKQAQRLKVDDLVEWKSRLDRGDLLGEYSKASVFVNLSRLESYGRTIMEALCIGLPAVVALDGAVSTVAHRGNVRTVHPDDPGEVANGILEWLTRPGGQTGQVHWVNWESYVTRMIELYDSVAAGWPSRGSS